MSTGATTGHHGTIFEVIIRRGYPDGGYRATCSCQAEMAVEDLPGHLRDQVTIAVQTWRQEPVATARFTSLGGEIRPEDL